MAMFLVFTVILAALISTYTNGFHDTANAIATVVGTKVLTRARPSSLPPSPICLAR